MTNKNINAQEWLNEKYPIERACQRSGDSENKGKKRGYITKLDLSKGKLGKRFWKKEGNVVLFGTLKLEEFTKLRKLIIFSHELTELDVNDCKN
ncbi:MAG: hypothetical protein GBAus27B_000530 [Mycoplasmataceae bacterium]|nr:MAG: hypothetical protein GBAus27B_000530 [Mycoplasmataceae bacterium]